MIERYMQSRKKGKEPTPPKTDS